MAGAKKRKANQAGIVRLPSYRARRITVLTVIGLAFSSLVWRSLDRQVFETAFLQEQGERRYLRTMTVSASRGMITDRNGEPLAISTPVKSVAANPRVIKNDNVTIGALASTLSLDPDRLRRLLSSERSFVYLKRRINPDLSEQVRALDLDGIDLLSEYRRFYPSSEVMSQMVGFTNIDDQGQEGMELAYDDWLSGSSGAKRVIKDGKGRVVTQVENIQSPSPGKDLVLSIDRRLQFLAYRELKAAVSKHRARSGSAVILDSRSGEILAMVNSPSYNPNALRGRRSSSLRNRVVTDVFEPGSTIKPFTVAAAVEMGRFRPDTPIDVSPGQMKVGRYLVRDPRNYGMIDVATVLRKSSNVGVSKIALSLKPETLWKLYANLGFGESPCSQFPGESSGRLPHFSDWSSFEQATLSFGYGLSVTPLQLARAYAVLANDGVRLPVSLLKQEEPVEGERVIRQSTARTVVKMLEAVVTSEGTALQAAVPGYRVAGKTGTAKKSVAGGYSEDKYLSLFVGLAPASDPRLVMAVFIDEPRGKEYYGGLVAGPVFSKVMSGALRLMNIPPDKPWYEHKLMARVGDKQ
ncbi:MAG: penicillin-binding protein 2 [Candidatus Thiodiazotropha sp. (ex Lucinoma aequizonata)]|nr:penicillin-binding protein 2 [Candidatus Thiodiazotropha sp. (ex Lucinoma aequizonata)]MCU7889535.1 penicillin-binding protein 2 [Candidatus Thiodiazotropha sp. (ex Lucinoma aequizonata)]MCU7894500.1 penicillin-binding protein 2 [Candidatus Thiodiazotropha sp. (ex Lucinoma aequizonata)]MCU7898877.1 penicillin-binding protein 2 [Candidatus Thiodiazotropha sp. (ex Lucinoma aequizonata)]MCU7900608.1 penicillin-binding protein 2 [Candidatus Thiodiazotropha sp. (ex Lucinoma aequizonata)]